MSLSHIYLYLYLAHYLFFNNGDGTYVLLKIHIQSNVNTPENRMRKIEDRTKNSYGEGFQVYIACYGKYTKRG